MNSTQVAVVAVTLRLLRKVWSLEGGSVCVQQKLLYMASVKQARIGTGLMITNQMELYAGFLMSVWVFLRVWYPLNCALNALCKNKNRRTLL